MKGRGRECNKIAETSYNKLQGMIGATLPKIKSLELEALTDGSDEPENGDKEDIVIQKVKKKQLELCKIE